MKTNRESQDSKMNLELRKSEFPIDEQFLSRWSPRAYDDSTIPESELMTMFEAARWAPSAYNVQPWRFLYALRDDPHWPEYLSLIDPFNEAWAKRAGALIFLLSNSLMPDTNPPKPFASHSFDAGAAWIHIALQAHKLGYQAHAMGGIFHQQIKQTLLIPDHYKVEIGIAIGRVGDPITLPEALRKREAPSQRMPLSKLIGNGSFVDLESITSKHERKGI